MKYRTIQASCAPEASSVCPEVSRLVSLSAWSRHSGGKDCSQENTSIPSGKRYLGQFVAGRRAGVAECYGCQIKLSKTKEDVTRCRTLVAGKKLTGISGTGTVRIYNATSRLIQAEAQALKNGQDLRHTLISNLDDPDNPSNQRISVTGVSFDDLTLADCEAAKLGQIEAPFTFEDFDVLDS